MDVPKTDDKKPDVQAADTTQPIEPAESMTPPVAPTAEPVMPVEPVKPVSSVSPVTPPSPTPVAPNDPAPAVPLDQTAGVKTKSNNMIYILIAVLIIILLSLAGLFFYRQFSAATNQQAEIAVPTPIEVSPTIVVPTYASPEEKDVMGIDVGNVDSQLKIIEDDVKKL